jgi:hypothetical protein
MINQYTHTHPLIYAKYNPTPLNTIYNLSLPQTTHTYGCKLQLELLRIAAIASETCRAKKYRGIRNKGYIISTSGWTFN